MKKEYTEPTIEIVEFNDNIAMADNQTLPTSCVGFVYGSPFWGENEEF